MQTLIRTAAPADAGPTVAAPTDTATTDTVPGTDTVLDTLPRTDRHPRKEFDAGLRLGIDVGGTAIKFGVVDTATGRIVGSVDQVPTPAPATPDAVADALTAVLERTRVRHPGLHPSVGVAFPAVVRNGVTLSAANVSELWLGFPIDDHLSDRLGCHVRAVNDADAAGLAEAAHTAGLTKATESPAAADVVPGKAGGGAEASVVLVLTLGTGIGSALVVDGRLVPNLELGHLMVDGEKAEARASAVARERDGLGWEEYAQRLQRYLSHVEFLFSPDLIIIGGGISVRHKDFLPHLSLRTPVVPAGLANGAGVVGAALTVRD